MDAGTSGIIGVLVSTVYDKLKQGNWPLWVNQLMPLLLALGGALIAPSVQGVPFVVKDVLGTFLTIYGAMQATYVGARVVSGTSTVVADKVHVLRKGKGIELPTIPEGFTPVFDVKAVGAEGYQDSEGVWHASPKIVGWKAPAAPPG